MPIPSDAGKKPEEFSKWRGYPVQEFKGTLKGMNFAADSFDLARTNVRCEFYNIEIIRTEEPYPHPIVTIDMPYSTGAQPKPGANSPWSVLTASIRAIIESDDMNLLEGKAQHWSLEMVKLSRGTKDEYGNDVLKPNGKVLYTVQPALGWVVKAVDGFSVGGATAGPDWDDAVAALAVGKTDEQFKAAFLNGGELKSFGVKFTDSVPLVMQNQLLPLLVAQGKVAKVGDVYAVVA